MRAGVSVGKWELPPAFGLLDHPTLKFKLAFSSYSCTKYYCFLQAVVPLLFFDF
jgi:hypothetical protein